MNVISWKATEDVYKRQDKRDVILLSYFLEMTDAEIGKELDTVRQNICLLYTSLSVFMNISPSFHCSVHCPYADMNPSLCPVSYTHLDVYKRQP